MPGWLRVESQARSTQRSVAGEPPCRNGFPAQRRQGGFPLLGARISRGETVILIVLSAWMAAAPVLAQNETADLDRAIQLYDQGDYLSAQELLIRIDRSKLSAQRQAVRDNYLSRIQVAITMKEKALRDLEDAETALSEDERDQARKLLERVTANKYAPESVLRSARTHLRSLAAPVDRAPETPVRVPQQEPPPVTPAATDAKPVEEPETAAPPTEERVPIEAEPVTTEEVTAEPVIKEPITGSEQQPAPTPPDVDAAIPPVQEDRIPAAAVQFQRAKVLTQEGDEAVRAARYDDAARFYQQALAAVPGFPEAQDGLARVRRHEQNLAGTRADSLIDRIRREDQINWQRAVAEYRDVERLIRDQVAGERFEDARRTMHRARQVVESGKQFADPVTKYESLKDELGMLDAFVQDAEREYNRRTVAATRREIEAQRKKRLLEIEERRTRQVDGLMNQVLQHRKDGDLEAAISVLEQVIVIDPKHKPARWLMDTLEDLNQYQSGRGLRDEFYKQQRRSLMDVERSKIPWQKQLRYPKDWVERIARPTRQGPRQSTRTSQLHSALDKRIPVDFMNEPFEGVLERFADDYRLNIIVNWNDLKRAGVDRTVPIDLSLPNEITLKMALTEVLNQAGSGAVEIGYVVGDEAIRIATRHTLDRETYTAVYDINDLLMEIPMFTDSPISDLAQANEQGRLRRNERADMPWRYGDDDDDESEEDPARTGRVRKLIELIQETVAPDSWIDRGGTIGTMKEFNGQLVVTHNTAGQTAISSLLGKLREQRAIQIAVEARFITVTSNYLEELGLDLDIVLNSGNAGFDYIPTGQGPLIDPVLGNALLLPRTFTRLGFAPANAALGQGLVQTPATIGQPFGSSALVPARTRRGRSNLTPFPIINQVSAFTDASLLGSDVPGSFAGGSVGPAFSLFGSFLDNIQVDFLIRATQADSRSTVLTAPQLVLFNGQRSWVAVTLQQNFISQLTPVVGTGAVAQAPQTATINSGAVLDVTATVTADRRYVTMTLRPAVTRLLDLQTIPFSGGGAGGGFGGGAALNAFIQFPLLSSQRVQTTVSVPDGGTLLIGGQKLASETEVEAGVPILSKIPILKRLYSSRSMVKDEQTLLMLVKPTIIIPPEQEELAFPSFRQP